jgi:hypothetical protein
MTIILTRLTMVSSFGLETDYYLETTRRVEQGRILMARALVCQRSRRRHAIYLWFNSAMITKSATFKFRRKSGESGESSEDESSF